MNQQNTKPKTFMTTSLMVLVAIVLSFSGCGVVGSKDSASGGVGAAAANAVSSITGNAQM